MLVHYVTENGLLALGVLSSDAVSGSYYGILLVVPQDAKSHPADGVLVYGMHIEGASWDHATKRLCDPRPDQMRAPAPIVHFLPETDHEPNPGEQLGSSTLTGLRHVRSRRQ